MFISYFFLLKIHVDEKGYIIGLIALFSHLGRAEFSLGTSYTILLLQMEAVLRPYKYA
jgi:hypothetical protein